MQWKLILQFILSHIHHAVSQKISIYISMMLFLQWNLQLEWMVLEQRATDMFGKSKPIERQTKTVLVLVFSWGVLTENCQQIPQKQIKTYGETQIRSNFLSLWFCGMISTFTPYTELLWNARADCAQLCSSVCSEYFVTDVDFSFQRTSVDNQINLNPINLPETTKFNN